MSKRFALKVGLISFLMLMLMIPLTMIEGVVGERSSYRDEARQSIAHSWTGAQKLLGPVLVVPYEEKYLESVWDENLKKYRREPRTRSEKLYVLPQTLEVDGNVVSEERKRGLYAIPVYTAALNLKGHFDNSRVVERQKSASGEIRWKSAYVALLVSDLRGVVAQPVLNWNSESAHFASGARIASGQGMNAEVGVLSATAPAQYSFQLSLELHGMETLEFAPVGDSTRVSLHSDWPHPSFIGRYLPAERHISANEFGADWKISSFSSDMSGLARDCETGLCAGFEANTFGVSLMNSVDIYQQTQRSVKYALLFIALSFVAFFLFEVMKNLRLHAMQYLLVGMVLTVFYLLLISLSEHIAFGWAYLIAASASTSLLGAYLSAILKSVMRSALFSGAFAILYGMLYLILLSEDNALLMGSILIFGTLALVMLVTRHVDWYRVSDQIAQDAVVKSGKEPKYRVEANPVA